MNLIFFPKYSSKGASSRYRIYNYLPYYRQAGFNIKVYPLFGDWYINCILQGKSKISIVHKIILAYLKRFFLIIFLKKKNILYIQAELLPFVPYSIENTLLHNKKYILDYDDAIFHNYDLNKKKYIRKLFSTKIPKLIMRAKHIFVGCEYLKQFALKFNYNVTIIPTSIDAEKYESIMPINSNDKIIIGWIGSSSTSKFILELLPVFKKLRNDILYELHLIGFDKNLESKLEGIPYQIIDWNNKTEVKEISRFSVGIMPLTNTPFNNGKCAFKLVQYMAVGVPTISTPLQSNINIDKKCGNLFAITDNEWFSAFITMINDYEKYKNVGLENKKMALKEYTIQKNNIKYLKILNAEKNLTIISEFNKQK